MDKLSRVRFRYAVTERRGDEIYLVGRVESKPSSCDVPFGTYEQKAVQCKTIRETVTVIRHACRKDKNHDEIAQSFRDLLWAWEDTSKVGPNAVPGFPDGVATKRGVTVFVEVKHGSAKQTPEESEFEQRCQGDYRVVRTVDDVRAIEYKYFGGGE